MTPKPDTSPANIARVLRAAAHAIPRGPYDRHETREAEALADALDATPVVTWEEREHAAPILSTIPEDLAALCGFHGGRLSRISWENRLEAACIELCETFGEREQRRPSIDAAIRAAFPELAPPTETQK